MTTWQPEKKWRKIGRHLDWSCRRPCLLPTFPSIQFEDFHQIHKDTRVEGGARLFAGLFSRVDLILGMQWLMKMVGIHAHLKVSIMRFMVDDEAHTLRGEPGLGRQAFRFQARDGTKGCNALVV